MLLAYWHGNASAVHRELVARADTADETEPTEEGNASSTDLDSRPATPLPGGAPPAAVPLLDPVPSLPTFLRAVRRDLTPGERVGYRGGPQAARAWDVFAKRPRTWRNSVWEADHVQAPLRVDADGDLVAPYVTWFIDCATKAITGVAVTPGTPTRASILAALRSAIVRTDPYGPFGGLPEHVRFDRGRDFLSRTVSAALTALDADITVLPPYSPHLKGTVENLNLNATRMLFAALPGYTPKKPNRRPIALLTRRRPCRSRRSPKNCWPGRSGGTPNTARPNCMAPPRFRRGRQMRPRLTTSPPRTCGRSRSRTTRARSPATACASKAATTSPTG
ncbi:integrase catalytic domain-containing protein [Streptomyces sp. YIM S03343]